MGEVADDMIDGLSCIICGLYFADRSGEEPTIYEHGYPVVCWDCWGELNKKERAEYVRATVETI